MCFTYYAETIYNLIFDRDLTFLFFFRGKLSPDNLRSYAIWAFDTTQSYAAQTYDWVYEKVQTLSKVPWIKSNGLMYKWLFSSLTKPPLHHTTRHLLFMTRKRYTYIFEDHECVSHFTCDISKRKSISCFGWFWRKEFRDLPINWNNYGHFFKDKNKFLPLSLKLLLNNIYICISMHKMYANRQKCDL